MLRSLWTAATGMVGQQHNIDTISNNLANVNTTGFKKNRAEFQDLLYQTIRPSGATNNLGAQYPTPIEIGHGVKLSSTQKSFIQGNLVETNNTLDMAIQGEGFFCIENPNGEVYYTRDGAFKVDSQGSLVTSSGHYMVPEVTIPAEATSVVIRESGDVVITTAASTDSQIIAQIKLVKFVNPAGLESVGGNLYKETEGTGEPIEGTPGMEGFGTLAQGRLEASNVTVVEEMVNLITAQRAYEINAKAITTSDDMLGIANNLKS
ncbi:MAG: flagellar basal-body rod protein FlgG [Spirochaetia bacterium]|nr:flagellar basal-body rod protein FlgG [Spirochaetia bacterium]